MVEFFNLPLSRKQAIFLLWLIAGVHDVLCFLGSWYRLDPNFNYDDLIEFENYLKSNLKLD